jgi:hypothetical protein
MSEVQIEIGNAMQKDTKGGKRKRKWGDDEEGEGEGEGEGEDIRERDLTFQMHFK